MSTSKQKDSSKNEQNRKGYPGLSNVIERNIQTILRLRAKDLQERSLQDKIADFITSFSGRMVFVYLHVTWFGVWVLLNTGKFGVKPFDPFPYGLLTMIVSLESVFLSAFLLISQNRSRHEDISRADLDMHVSLLTEHELTQALQMLDAIQKKLGVADTNKTELSDLEKETRPEDVLAEIDRLQEVIK